MNLKPSGMFSKTVEPPVSQNVNPPITVPIASVVTNDNTLKCVTIAPLINPIPKPMMTGIKMLTATGTPKIASLAATTPPRLAIAPIDRSNSCTLITRVTFKRNDD